MLRGNDIHSLHYCQFYYFIILQIHSIPFDYRQQYLWVLWTQKISVRVLIIFYPLLRSSKQRQSRFMHGSRHWNQDVEKSVASTSQVFQFLFSKKAVGDLRKMIVWIVLFIYSWSIHFVWIWIFWRWEKEIKLIWGKKWSHLNEMWRRKGEGSRFICKRQPFSFKYLFFPFDDAGDSKRTTKMMIALITISIQIHAQSINLLVVMCWIFFTHFPSSGHKNVHHCWEKQEKEGHTKIESSFLNKKLNVFKDFFKREKDYSKKP